MAYIYKKYMWLVRLLSQHKEGLPYQLISDLWSRSYLNEEGATLSKRTFHNWVNAIGDTLGVYIECEKCAPYRYHIINMDDLKEDLMEWAMNGFAMSEMLLDNREIKDRILLETIPSADDNLEVILAAMRGGNKIKMKYKPFDKEYDYEIVTEPYAVKLSRKRWYVLCNSVKHNSLFVFSVDRILSVEQTREKFVIDPNFSAERYFEGYIGVTYSSELEIADIELKISGYLQDYFNTLPLHDSQKVEEVGQDYTIYSYRLVPDHELVDIITGFGPKCEVLQSAYLRKEVYKSALAISKNNK